MIAGAIVLYEASPTPTTALKKESHFSVRKIKWARIRFKMNFYLKNINNQKLVQNDPANVASDHTVKPSPTIHFRGYLRKLYVVPINVGSMLKAWNMFESTCPQGIQIREL